MCKELLYPVTVNLESLRKLGQLQLIETGATQEILRRYKSRRDEKESK